MNKLFFIFLIILFILKPSNTNAQRALEHSRWSYGGNIGINIFGANSTSSQTFFGVNLRPEINYWLNATNYTGIRIGYVHSETYFGQYYLFGYNGLESSLFYKKMRQVFNSPLGIGFDHEIGYRNYKYEGVNSSGAYFFYHFTPVIYFKFSDAILFEVQMAQIYLQRNTRLYNGHYTLNYGFDTPGGNLFTIGLKVVPGAFRANK